MAMRTLFIRSLFSLLSCSALALAGCGGDDAAPLLRSHETDGTMPPPAAPSGGPTSASPAPPPAPAPAPTPTTPPVPMAPWPGSQLQFLTFPAQKMASGASWGTALTDIVRHLPSSYGNQYDFPDDRITWGHETTHGINSHVRNSLNTTGKRANGFYLMKDRAALVVEPPTTLLANVGTYVPASLRGSRYKTYLVDQVSGWNDTPTYVYDEWVAYTNGSEVGVELAKSGSWTEWRDGVAGTLEFTIYALALGLAVETKDAAYFASYTQFREFLAWNAERAMNLYRAGAVLPVFAWTTQDNYYTAWKTSADAIPLRNFARRTFGEAYCTKVLEITAAKE